MGKIKKRVVVKAAVDIVVSAGVGILAQNAVKMIMPTDLNKPKMILAKVGAFAVTTVITAAVTDHISGTIDRMAAGYDAGVIAAQRAASDKEAQRIAEEEMETLREKLAGDSKEED